MIQEHDTFKLTCTVQGFPQPQVSWYHSGRDITNNPRYSVTYASGRCSIEIGNAESGDAGKYTCRAVNTLGEAECSCNVVVEESASQRITTGRNRRATSLQPMAYSGASGGYSSSSVVNSNRLSRLSSQQDSFMPSSYVSSTQRSRRVSDIDNSYSSTASNGGYEITTEYSTRSRRNIGSGFADDIPRSRIRAGSENRFNVNRYSSVQEEMGFEVQWVVQRIYQQ
ncbi:unc-22 [Bugula neritina]|uniref:Unc-22 n=1 Tax=Bugula neritina TaxID=10212 RepID=A0A7J7JEF9_BUGNE|nr:unc-22 [Bugula neritina]